MNSLEPSDSFRIGEASRRTELPESTIRYYDREFSDYLDLTRGSNNERLFTEDNLRDLEYIRYLIKRKNLSVKEVKQRLQREMKFEGEEKGPGGTPPGPDDRVDQDQLRTMEQAILSEIQSLKQRLDQLKEQMDRVQDDQQTIRNLLDMNLQRYNKLVEDLSF